MGQVTRLSPSLTENSLAACGQYCNRWEESGDEDATGYCIMYAHMLVLNHVLPRAFQDNVFSGPPNPGIPYRTRSNTNAFLAYVRAGLVVLLPPAVDPSKLSSGVLHTKRAYV